MKKTIVKVLAVSVLIFLFGLRDVHAEKKVTLGFKAGYNFASHWSHKEKLDDSSILIRPKLSVFAGALASFKLSNSFRLQMEILYNQKGAKHDVTIPYLPIGTLSVVYDFRYLEVPVILKYYIRKGKGRFQPILSLGPYFSFLLKSVYSVSNPYTGIIEYDIEDVKKTDMGFTGGPGIEIHDDNIVFGIFYRSSMGFVNLDLPTGPGAPTVSLRNYCHMITFEISY
jgi:hypothetical protein